MSNQTAASNVDEKSQEWLSFQLENNDYAIDILRVIEIRVWEPVTPIPYANNDIHGLINLRGAIVPIINLKRRLGLGKTDPEAKASVVVLIVAVQQQGKEKIVGMAVDGIADVLEVNTEDSSKPDFQLGIEAHYVTGITEHDNKVVIQLDLDRVYGDENGKLITAVNH